MDSRRHDEEQSTIHSASPLHTSQNDGECPTDDSVPYRNEQTPLLNRNSNSGSSNGNDTTWFLTTASLSFCMMIQSYLLVGVFPYAGFLAMHLIDGVTEETAGKYAGLIASSFMMGRFLSSYAWGKAADRYGRIFCIQSSLALSAVFSVLFGLSPTFGCALAARFGLGLCNGLIGPIKTIVSEVTDNDPKSETKMLAIVMGTWGYGFLINPAVSGYLSDPLKQYPDFDFGLLWEPLLRRFPFVLPNLLACFWCFLGYMLVRYNVPETLPEAKRQDFVISQAIFSSPSTTTLASLNSKTDEEEQQSPSKSTNEQAQEEGEQPATIRSLWSRPSTRQHLLAYWVYSFLVITIDEVFPLYCISKDSGLGIQEHRIGNLLSTTGLCYVFIQYFLLTNLVESFGFYKSLRIGALLSIPVACLVPLSLWTNSDAMVGQLTWSTVIYLSVVYATIRVFSSVAFSTLTMTTNRTVPNHHRATMNGLSMMGGSIAKACGPAFGGLFFSWSVGTLTPPLGAWLVYGVVSMLGLGLFVQVSLLDEAAPPTEETKSQESGSFSNGKRGTKSQESGSFSNGKRGTKSQESGSFSNGKRGPR